MTLWARDPWRHLLWLLLLAGCAPRVTEDEPTTEARRQTELARTLELAGDKREAAHEYTIVAERYPGTSYQAVAAWRAGLLYADPANPARNDSLAIHWLGQYLQLSVPQAERYQAEVCLKLIERTVMLRNELTRLAATQDSLATALKRQAAGVTSLNKRIGELETELEQTSRELKRLKQIDARTRPRSKP